MAGGGSGGSGGSGSEGGRWDLIESDPAVFTELIRSFGASGVQVEELWSLDAEAFEPLRPIHGLVFLFKWGGEVREPAEPRVGDVVRDSRLETIFFAKQVIENACATQAVVNLLLNCEHPDLELGGPLKGLKEFCRSFDPHMKGLALANSAEVRAAHNSFARRSLFEIEPATSSSGDDAFHFVAYAPVQGRLYELDGLKEGPVDLGAVPAGSEWTDLFRDIVRRRIERYKEGEIRFNLMALVSDRKLGHERAIAAVEAKIETAGMETDADRDELLRLRTLLDAEIARRERDRAEIARRRHDYLAFIVELLKILARERKLMPLYEKAKEKALRKVARKLDV